MDYQVRLDSFEGPLDLLLHLIKKHEIDIMDIPVSMITEQYLSYIEMMKLLDLDLAGEYVLMAATLMHIKSKMLLPPSDDEEGDEEEGDPRAELVKRLLEYKKYKDASQQLGEMDMLGRDNFLKGSYADIDEDSDAGEELFGDVSLFDLMEALNEVMKEVAAHKVLEISLDSVSVKEKMDMIRSRIGSEGNINFLSLFDTSSSKADMVATFLALLELIRTREAKAFQGENFGTIMIMPSATLH